ncbi:hypothetical protein FQ182_14910 [Pseudomonas sp. ANT_H4]|nr:hypothetical protein FQ182_14910 [Pseudomonas sp. ANT_H4]
MSTPPAGTTKKRLFSRNDYLAPLPIPTGEKPSDVLNTIWRKNEVFLDIGNYSIRPSPHWRPTQWTLRSKGLRRVRWGQPKGLES